MGIPHGKPERLWQEVLSHLRVSETALSDYAFISEGYPSEESNVVCFRLRLVLVFIGSVDT